MIENPNDYNDNAWTEASTAAIAGIAHHIDKLWSAGASLENIEQDIQNAFENCNSEELASAGLTVVIS